MILERPDNRSLSASPAIYKELTVPTSIERVGNVAPSSATTIGSVAVAGIRRFRDLRTMFNEFCRAREGNLAVIFALAAVPVIGTVGAAVDFSKISEVRTQMQNALDAAVLAGVTQASANQVSTAGKVFDGDFSGKFGTTATRSFTQNVGGSLSGTASTSVSWSFMSV